MASSRIAGDVDLSAATLAQVDLSDAVIGKELRLRGLYGATTWRVPDQSRPTIVLRNTQAGALQDSLDSWPVRVDLEGFSYEHLGGVGATSDSDPNYRTTAQWKDWLAKAHYENKPFNPGPYTHLAKVLVASGKPDQAFAIQFAARDADRDEAWHNEAWARWAWLSFLRWVFGYGIGPYTFSVLAWIAGSVVMGVLVLREARAARAKGIAWCTLASLSRLLPVVELNKEFTEFFNDPLRDRLNNTQVIFFSLYALWGWVLGLVLIAAVSGLTQHA
jgi:hypothetical protein